MSTDQEQLCLFGREVQPPAGEAERRACTIAPITGSQISYCQRCGEAMCGDDQLQCPVCRHRQCSLCGDI